MRLNDEEMRMAYQIESTDPNAVFSRTGEDTGKRVIVNATETICQTLSGIFQTGGHAVSLW